jgi:long-subunit acyl-CoA synthetase (AMP-forming)
LWPSRNGKFIRIANKDGQLLEDGDVGDIYIRGPDMAAGYWKKPGLNKQFQSLLSGGEHYFDTGDLGPDMAAGYWKKPGLNKQFQSLLSDGEHYFNTGDLGKIVDGRLFVVGRSKELYHCQRKEYLPN